MEAHTINKQENQGREIKFSDSQRRAVLRWVRNNPRPDCARPLPVAVEELGISARIVRAILSACDGEDLVVGYCPDGVFCARNIEDAEVGTAQLESRASVLRKRAERRRDYFDRLEAAKGEQQLTLGAVV